MELLKEVENLGTVCVIGSHEPYLSVLEKARKVILVSSSATPPTLSTELVLVQVDPLGFQLQEPVNVLVIDSGSNLAQLLWYNFKNVLDKIVVNGVEGRETIQDFGSFGYSIAEGEHFVVVSMKKELSKQVNKKRGCGCGKAISRQTSEQLRRALRGQRKI
jgi:hypothetical protein